MSGDTAWDLSCHKCAHAWLRYDGAQCYKDPHNYQTTEQIAISKWLTAIYGVGGFYPGQCPGFKLHANPSDAELEIEARRFFDLVETGAVADGFSLKNVIDFAQSIKKDSA